MPKQTKTTMKADVKIVRDTLEKHQTVITGQHKTVATHPDALAALSRIAKALRNKA